MNILTAEDDKGSHPFHCQLGAQPWEFTSCSLSDRPTLICITTPASYLMVRQRPISQTLCDRGCIKEEAQQQEDCRRQRK